MAGKIRELTEEMAEDTSDTIVEQLLTVDSVYLDRLFTLGMLVFFATFLYVARDFSDESQLFPYVVGIPSFLLVIGLFLVQWSARLNAFIDNYRSEDLFEVDNSFEDDLDYENEVDLRTSRIRTLKISAWIIGLFILIYLFGFLPATLLFLLFYFNLESKLSWPRTILFTGLVWLFIVVLFDMILNTPFYTGVFRIVIPVPDIGL